MKYYVSRTHVFFENDRISGYETVLTKPDTLETAKNGLSRLKALGIENLYLCEHPANSRRWGKLDRAQTKRTKTRKLTMADVAADLEELEKESRESGGDS